LAVSPQNHWNTLYRIAVLAAVLLALAGVIFAFWPKVTRFRSYQETKEALEADIRTKEESIKALRLDQERFSTDKTFVQKLAHETGYAHEGETVFQFNNEQGVSNPVPEVRDE
jgi:cell division protein FtsB